MITYIRSRVGSLCAHKGFHWGQEGGLLLDHRGQEGGLLLDHGGQEGSLILQDGQGFDRGVVRELDIVRGDD